jgi:hypothetical protein
MASRRSAAGARTREAAREANRQAEEERTASGWHERRRAAADGTTTETFSTTFTFADGTSTTQEFTTEAERSRQEAFFEEGRSRGCW